MDLVWLRHDLAPDPVALPGRTVSPKCWSGDVRYGVISQGQGLAFGQRRIGTGRCEGVGLRVPLVEMPKYPFDHIDIVDDCD